jgi:hypothetical protein
MAILLLHDQNMAAGTFFYNMAELSQHSQTIVECPNCNSVVIPLLYGAVKLLRYVHTIAAYPKYYNMANVYEYFQILVAWTNYCSMAILLMSVKTITSW